MVPVIVSGWRNSPVWIWKVPPLLCLQGGFNILGARYPAQRLPELWPHSYPKSQTRCPWGNLLLQPLQSTVYYHSCPSILILTKLHVQSWKTLLFSINIAVQMALPFLFLLHSLSPHLQQHYLPALSVECLWWSLSLHKVPGCLFSFQLWLMSPKPFQIPGTLAAP